jgi:hypothetical protein
MPLYTVGGKLLVVDGKLATNLACCCQITNCADLTECFGFDPTVVATFTGIADNDCDECVSLNGSYAVPMTETINAPGLCRWEGTADFGTACDLTIRVDVSVQFSITFNTWIFFAGIRLMSADLALWGQGFDLTDSGEGSVNLCFGTGLVNLIRGNVFGSECLSGSSTCTISV